MPHKSLISGLCGRPASAALSLLALALPIAATKTAQAQTYTYSVVYSFAGAPTDGSDPTAELVLDAQGNLYGTTYAGGIAGYGTVFKIDTTGKETVLHTFAGAAGTDGANPYAGLALDAQGNLYGTTVNGGDPSCRTGGCGTVFKVDTAGNETVLYSFRVAGGRCVSSRRPIAGCAGQAVRHHLPRRRPRNRNGFRGGHGGN